MSSFYNVKPFHTSNIRISRETMIEEVFDSVALCVTMVWNQANEATWRDWLVWTIQTIGEGWTYFARLQCLNTIQPTADLLRSLEIL